MKLVMVGAGGVGGYFGGRLAQKGFPIHFLVRPKTKQAILEKGLRIESIDGDALLEQLSVTDQPETLGIADIVLIAVKAWHLEEVAKQIEPIVGEQTVVVPLLNGVESARVLRSNLKQGKVVGGMCRILSHKKEAGWICHSGFKPDVHVGSLDGQYEKTLDVLQEWFAQAGIQCHVHQHIQTVLWRKFLFVVTMGSVGAVVRAPIGVVRNQSESRVMLRACLEEIYHVALAQGVDLGLDSIEQTLAFIDDLPPEGIASMHRDIMNGNPSEMEAWTGAVVRLGREKGVATPVFDVIYACLLPHEKRARGILDF